MTWGSKLQCGWGKCASAFTSLRKPILNNKIYGVPAKSLLVTALCLSHLRFNLGTLGPFNARQSKHFATAYARAARACAGMHSNNESHFALLQVLARVGWIDYQTFILLEQMRYLKRFLCYAPLIAFALLEDCGPLKRCWKTSILQSIRNFASLLPTRHPFATAPTIDAKLTIVAEASQRSWKATIKRAAKCATSHLAERERVQRWRIKFAIDLVAAGAHHPGLCIEQELSSAFKCTQCAFACGSFQGLRSHVARVHEVKHVATFFAGDFTHCRACMKDFSTRNRLIRHIKAGAHCMHALRCINIGSADALETDEPRLSKPEREKLERLPATQKKSGPRATSVFTRDQAAPPLPQGFSLGQRTDEQELINDAEARQLYVRAPPVPYRPESTSIGIAPPSCRKGSRPVVLALFAGRRRDLDLQHAIETAFAAAGMLVTVLSYDFVYGPERDLLDPANI